MTDPVETEKSTTIRWLEHLLVLGLSVMGLMVLSNVILRYVFDSGIAVSEEVSRFIFVWLTMVGAVVAMKQGLHLGMGVVVRRLPHRWGVLARLVASALMLFCCGLLFKGSLAQARLNADNVAALSGLPVGLMYGAGIVASVFMALIILQDMRRTFSRWAKPATSAHQQAQEV